MNGHVVPVYDAAMQQFAEAETLEALERGPLVCPVCWDHGVERIEGVTLSADNLRGKPISGALLYHCSHWHIFAVFESAR
jgi:hypothetical protein